MPHDPGFPSVESGEAGHPWPAWAGEFQTDDEDFAAAHDALSSLQRAWIKQSLARLFAVHDPGGPVRHLRRAHLSSDFESATMCRPRPWAVVTVGSDFASPARLLAACLPAIRAGVEALAVVRVGRKTSWPPSVLAALELAGVETAFELTPARAGSFFSEIGQKTPGGIVVDFGTAGLLPAGVREVRCAPRVTLGVWRSAVRTFDLSALVFAHSESRVEVWGKISGLPAGVHVREGGFDAFLGCGYDAVFVPGGMIRRVLDAPFGPVLVFGPRMECFWTFPGLSVTDFLETRLAFAVAGPGRKGCL